MDDADWAAEMQDREIAALLARRKRGQAPPAPRPGPDPSHMDRVLDPEDGR